MSALIALLLVLQVPVDTALFPPKAELLRLYTNCDEARWPASLVDSLVPKTPGEVRAGVARRLELEAGWRRWYLAHGGDTLGSTPPDSWIYPLEVRGRLIDNYRQRRPGGFHEALDIFVPREGTLVRAPVNGVVVAAGDHWQGGWQRHVGLRYQGGGLSRRAGNGVLLFEPSSGGYFYLIHLQDSSVAGAAGDVVRAGQLLGRVGHTGNAAQPGHGGHLHFAYKRPGSACGVDSVLVPVDPIEVMRRARAALRR